MMTAYGSIPVAVEAMRLGAFDFVTKPFRNEDVFPLLARIERLKRSAAAGRPAGRRARRRVGSSGRQPVGRDGTRQAHDPNLCPHRRQRPALRRDGRGQGPRRRRHPPPLPPPGFPYVKVGCTLFPPQLIESELYGHEKGSFTGADQRRRGRFDLAEGGTLYLDDVDDIPLAQQSKLLRAIEEKVFERVGGSAPIKADVRIIASTKRNLLEKIAEGTFREDLYYRLDVLRVNIPPLAGAAGGRAPAGRAPARADRRGAARRRWTPRPWKSSPATTGPATSASCPIPWSGPTWWAPATSPPRCWRPRSAAAAAEAAAPPRMPRAAISRPPWTRRNGNCWPPPSATAGGNKTAAAAALGMKPSTFRDKLAKHGLG